MVLTYLHFRIQKFPLIFQSFGKTHPKIPARDPAAFIFTDEPSRYDLMLLSARQKPQLQSSRNCWPHQNCISCGNLRSPWTHKHKPQMYICKYVYIYIYVCVYIYIYIWGRGWGFPGSQLKFIMLAFGTCHVLLYFAVFSALLISSEHVESVQDADNISGICCPPFYFVLFFFKLMKDHHIQFSHRHGVFLAMSLFC